MTDVRPILSRVFAMTRQEALVVITIQQLVPLHVTQGLVHSPKHSCLAVILSKSLEHTLPTLAVSSFAFSRTKITPCDGDATASSSASIDGAARPPTISNRHCYADVLSSKANVCADRRLNADHNGRASAEGGSRSLLARALWHACSCC